VVNGGLEIKMITQRDMNGCWADNKDLQLFRKPAGRIEVTHSQDELQTFEDLCISPVRIVVARQPIRFPQYFCQELLIAIIIGV
jgi:hypothetical protein